MIEIALHFQEWHSGDPFSGTLAMFDREDYIGLGKIFHVQSRNSMSVVFQLGGL